MSNREGLAALCIGAALLVLGVALAAPAMTWFGVLAVVVGLGVLAWNLLAADQQERRKG